MLEKLYIAGVTLLDKLIWTLDVGPRVHRIFLAPSVGTFRVVLGKIRAVRLYRYAYKRVPAYKKHVDSQQQKIRGPVVKLTSVSLNDVPEMDKATYIKKHDMLSKLVDGILPASGVMFDESSGSSGKPTSWVRGRKERRMTQRIMQVAFNELIDGRQPIVLNTFSMGAWATGFNTSLCLVGITRVKSLGPDITKVIDTLIELGPDFDYVIMGYPPFLQQITQSEAIDWKKYKISAVYGGEGISESMRKQMLCYYESVVGSYGASDLEINIAHESDFTIALRQALVDDPELRKALLHENRGIIPMIFQYNPYDYLFETNEKGELLVTICRVYNLSPRIRYNIHDIGHAMNFYDLKKQLASLGRKDLLSLVDLDFGVLFHYGRSDLSVDYNGAVVGPDEVRQIINGSTRFTDKITNFRLISYEDKTAQKHLLIAIELKEGVRMEASAQNELLDYIIEQLKALNLDFKSAYRTAPNKPEIHVYQHATSIFDEHHTKLKNDYIWNIDYKTAQNEGLVK